MKVISLLPVKNESWVLRFSLKNFSLFSDEILILDDGSQDQLLELVKEFPKVSVIPFSVKEKHVDMSLRRNTLLTEGRARGGTHFVCLDADEVFSQTSIFTLSEILPTLTRGETLLLPWIILAKDSENDTLYFDTKGKKKYKDFIFCDDKISVYEKKFLSESRTPGKDTLKKIVPFEKGCVLHFIYIAGKRTQLKQAWYRASELIEGTRSARKINATYAVTKRSLMMSTLMKIFTT
jgi:glycosyltransferase involved in cell wall biosynthesis